jgi:hypothetical protein
MPNLQFNEKLELQKTHTHTHTLSHQMFGLHNVWMCIVVYSCACLGAKVWIKSISSGAQYATLRKYFSHLSLVMYSFATPHQKKLKLGQQQIGGGTTNSKPPGPIIMMGPIRNTLSSS